MFDIKITKLGIHFPSIIYLWPWKRNAWKLPEFNKTFKTKEEAESYWKDFTAKYIRYID